MKALINWHMFTQTSLDSGLLTMLGAVFHNFSEPGEYIGTILQKDEAVGNFRLTVTQERPDTQVNIDLATLHRGDLDPTYRRGQKRFVVNSKRYTLFHVSRGAGGYAVVVDRLYENGNLRPSFDSRELKVGDLFAATIIRPGTYSVTNVNTEAKGEIRVAYPKPGKVPYRPSKPVSIDCTKERLNPNKIEITAAQGQVYHINTPSRIKIELVKPDDNPPR